jgi:hypothetical protein
MPGRGLVVDANILVRGVLGSRFSLSLSRWRSGAGVSDLPPPGPEQSGFTTGEAATDCEAGIVRENEKEAAEL